MKIYIDNWINANNNIPTNKELDKLDIGYSVKISNGKERFWVEIKKIDKHFLLGKIDNKLLSYNEYNYNDLVLFEKINIYDIHDLEFKKLLLKYVNKNNKIKKNKNKNKNKNNKS